MGEAVKLFESSGGPSSGGKQQVINGAAMTMMKFVVQVRHTEISRDFIYKIYVHSPSLAAAEVVPVHWEASWPWCVFLADARYLFVNMSKYRPTKLCRQEIIGLAQSHFCNDYLGN